MIDSESRAVYDERGLDGLSGAHGSGGMDPNEFMSELFGRFAFDMGGPTDTRRRAKDSIIPYDVTLEDLYNGKHVKMNMEKEVPCGTCNG